MSLEDYLNINGPFGRDWKLPQPQGGGGDVIDRTVPDNGGGPVVHQPPAPDSWHTFDAVPRFPGGAGTSGSPTETPGVGIGGPNDPPPWQEINAPNFPHIPPGGPGQQGPIVPTPPASSGFGSQPWHQSDAGQQFFNHLKQLFPHLSDADIGANLNFDRMPDQRYQQELINNFARNAPKTSTTSTAATPGGPVNGNYQDWFMQQIAGKPFNQQTLLDLEPLLNKYGMKLTPANQQGERTKIQLPDGTWVRVGFGEGHPVWISQGAGGGTGAPGAGAEFSDPWGSSLEGSVAAYLKKLGIDPARPGLQQYIDRLLSADKNNQANTKQFVDRLTGRRDELLAPPFSAGDESVLRAKAFDQLERRRSETLKNNRNAIYARGFEPTSGIAAQSDFRTNTDFEQARTGIESDLTQAMMGETQARRDKALSLDQLVQQALNGGDLASLDFLAKHADTEDNLIQDSLNRARQSIAAIGIPLDLMAQRQGLANQTLGLGGNPQSIMNSILGILQAGNQSRSTAAASSNNNYAGIGQLLSILFPSGR